tara:strand:- start:28 stop:456 length:429 start_codon:yes stop_codon:yes gene_type:complete
MSTLVIDTIQGKTAAGSVNVRGEGSNNTNLQQGLAKIWGNFHGSISAGTPNVRDSLNVSSVDDDGNGDFGLHYTTSMGNTNYSVTLGMDDMDVSTAVVGSDTTYNTRATGSIDIEFFYVTSGINRTNYDYDTGYFTIHGDLA